MTHTPLKVSDAKTHMVVVVWFLRPGSGEERYLYRDKDGAWYILNACGGGGGRVYLTPNDAGEFEGVTHGRY